MSYILSPKWRSARAQVPEEDLKLLKLTGHLTVALDTFEDLLDKAEEMEQVPEETKKKLKTLQAAYNTIAKGYLHQIVSANKEHPERGKSWKALYKALEGIDSYVSKVPRTNPALRGWYQAMEGLVNPAFKTLSDSQRNEIHEEDEKGKEEKPRVGFSKGAGKAGLGDYLEEGFVKLLSKVKAKDDPLQKMDALLEGCITCFGADPKLGMSLQAEASGLQLKVKDFKGELKKGARDQAQIQFKACVERAKTFAGKLPKEGKSLSWEIQKMLGQMNQDLLTQPKEVEIKGAPPTVGTRRKSGSAEQSGVKNENPTNK